MAAVAASATAMAAVVESNDALSAEFGSWPSREACWDSATAADALMASANARAWMTANVQSSVSQNVSPNNWGTQITSKKCLLLSSKNSSSSTYKFRYTRTGGETAEYNNTNWNTLSVAMASLQVYNSSGSTKTIETRYVLMQE
jgi:hypothetical protein